MLGGLRFGHKPCTELLFDPIRHDAMIQRHLWLFLTYQGLQNRISSFCRALVLNNVGEFRDFINPSFMTPLLSPVMLIHLYPLDSGAAETSSIMNAFLMCFIKFFETQK
jgi:hypothetical protein